MFQKVIQNLNKGQLSPIYTIMGNETYLQSVFMATLLTQFDDRDALDIVRLDLEEVSMEDVLNEANMYSFFSEMRLVIVDHADFMGSSPKYKLTDAETKALVNYIEHPNESSILILMTSIENVDKRKKVSKLIEQKTVNVDCRIMDDKQVTRYVQDYLANVPFDISKEALTELLSRVDYQLTLAMGEVAKLNIYALNHDKITLDVIRTLVPRTLQSDVFTLTTAVLNKHISKAVQIYQDLILMKHEPIALHALLISQFRLFIQVSILSQKGQMEGQIAQALSVHPYRVKLARQSIQHMQLRELLTFYNELAETDYYMKTSIGEKTSHFYLLLTKFAKL